MSSIRLLVDVLAKMRSPLETVFENLSDTKYILSLCYVSVRPRQCDGIQFIAKSKCGRSTIVYINYLEVLVSLAFLREKLQPSETATNAR